MSKHRKFRFQLYVAGDAQNSALAINNLRTLCRTYLPEQHEIEIVDVFKESKLAMAKGIFMTPTLVKLSQSPMRKIVGTLTQTQTVLQTLGLEDIAK